jgi:predicted DNA-binding transcriptional regulator AlpA
MTDVKSPVIPEAESPVMRKPEAMRFTGLRKTQFEEKVIDGELPAPIKLTDSGRAVAWLRCEMEEWLKARVKKRNEQPRKKREAAS